MNFLEIVPVKIEPFVVFHFPVYYAVIKGTTILCYYNLRMLIAFVYPM